MILSLSITSIIPKLRWRWPYDSIIVAVGKNRVIGIGGKIPCNIPKIFKNLTIGGIVVMGRKTFESIGTPF